MQKLSKHSLQHLAIIMDGNRRWAKEHHVTPFQGHYAGYENIERVIELCFEAHISYLTLWGLSTENLQHRSQKEITGIISIIDQAKNLLPRLQENNIRFQTIGDISALPTKTQTILADMTQATQENTSLTFTLALVYGGQDEILRGVQKVLLAGEDPDQLTAQSFREYLDVAILPVPDVIVRTGGDMRTSGFLLYDSPYSELYFTQTKWPDFGKEDFEQILDMYAHAKRNFGK